MIQGINSHLIGACLTGTRLVGALLTLGYGAMLAVVPLAHAAETTLPTTDSQAIAEAAQTACAKEATNRKFVVSSVQSTQPLNTGVRVVMNVKNGAYAFTVGCVYTTTNNTAALEAVSLRANSGNWRGMGKRVREACMQAARRDGMKILDVGTVNVTNDGGVLNLQVRHQNIDFRGASCIYADATGQADFVLR